MTQISPALVGFLRGLGAFLLAALLTYLADATHLQGVVTPQIAAVIAMLALALEHYVEGKTGNALFGAATVKRSY